MPGNWGLCQNCSWWRIEPQAEPAAMTIGLCMHEKLRPYLLRVLGVSGCNCFTAGECQREPGASAAPPFSVAS
jgi:hypothetical protein